MGDIELFVQCNQRRRHGVDDAVEVVLKTGKFFLDFAAYLDFQFQLAIGVAGFFGQRLRLIVRLSGLVPCAFERLIAYFNARQHGVECLGQATDFVVVAGRRAQCVVLLASDLAGQFFKAVNRLGNQALDLPRHHEPEQSADDQNAQAGR